MAAVRPRSIQASPDERQQVRPGAWPELARSCRESVGNPGNPTSCLGVPALYVHEAASFGTFVAAERRGQVVPTF